MTVDVFMYCRSSSAKWNERLPKGYCKLRRSKRSVDRASRTGFSLLSHIGPSQPERCTRARRQRAGPPHRRFAPDSCLGRFVTDVDGGGRGREEAAVGGRTKLVRGSGAEPSTREEAKEPTSWGGHSREPQPSRAPL